MIEKYLPRTEFDSYEDFKNNYRVIIPDDFNFGFDIVDGWAEREPSKPALIWCNDSLEVITYTFTDVKKQSNKAASFFSSLGISRGDKVMLMLKQRPEVWFAMVGLHKLGAVVIPATFQLTKKDIVYRCEAAGVKLIVTVDDRWLLNNVSESLPECGTLENIAVVGSDIPDGYIDFRRELESSSDVFERPSYSPAHSVRDPMLIYFSSGTTGMPKMLLHDYSYPLGHIVTAKYWQRVKNNGIHLTVSDSGWAKFGWGKIYGQWICGAAIAVYDTESFSTHGMLSAIRTLKPTSFCAPPTIYRFLIKDPSISGEDFRSVEHFATAGEPLNAEVLTRFKEMCGKHIYEGFGQSETSVLLASFPWFEPRAGSTGKPSPLYDIDIVDENGISCEDGIVGRIVVKNASADHPAGLFRCYFNNPEAQAQAWQNGSYDTGDTAWRDGDGYYWFVGRSDDVIKCSGYRIGPFEVESALISHKAVIECAITAAPDPVRGQVVKATVVLAPGYTPSPELVKELQNHVKKVTAPYKYPRIVEFVDELPKTLSGKIKRAQIRSENASAENRA